MIRVLGVLLLLAGVAGCAPPPTNAAMVPEALPVGAPAPAYRDAVTLGSVVPGSDGGAPWTSAVGPDQVREALARTLAAAGLAAGGSGRYRLDATLLTLGRPYAGFAMSVTAAIAYRLTEAATGRVVYEKTVTGLGDASLDDAITNENRLRIADQRAVRDNLRQLLQDLSVLPGR